MEYCKNDVPMIEQAQEKEEKGHKNLRSIVQSEVSDFKQDRENYLEAELENKGAGPKRLGPQLPPGPKTQQKAKRGLPGFMVAKRKDADDSQPDRSLASEEPASKRANVDSVNESSKRVDEPAAKRSKVDTAPVSASPTAAGFLGGYGSDSDEDSSDSAPFPL